VIGQLIIGKEGAGYDVSSHASFSNRNRGYMHKAIASLGFKRAHHVLRIPVRVDHCMHMARANVRRQQNPSTTRAGFFHAL
jgi:hypothetical protein